MFYASKTASEITCFRLKFAPVFFQGLATMRVCGEVKKPNSGVKN